MGLARPTAGSTRRAPGAGRLGEMLHGLGLEGLLEPAATRPTRTRSGCWRSARRLGPHATSSAPTAARRAGRAAATRCATPPPAPGSYAANDRLRAQRRPRGAARQENGERRVGHPAPRGRSGCGASSGRGGRPPSSSGCANPPSTRGYAPRRGPTPTPIPARCWAPGCPGDRPRRGAGPPQSRRGVPGGGIAGATGVVIPERRSAEVTPAVCKASAGAVEHLSVARVGNLANWLGEAKSPGPGSTALTTPPRPCPTTRRTTAAASCWCSGQRVGAAASRGRCVRPARAAPAARRRWSRSTSATAASALVYGILHFRAVPLDRAT